jgi:hypothetical protein
LVFMESSSARVSLAVCGTKNVRGERPFPHQDRFLSGTFPVFPHFPITTD